MRDRETITKLMEQFAGENELFRTQKYILEVLLDIRELLLKQDETPKTVLNFTVEKDSELANTFKPTSGLKFPPFDTTTTC
jgi:hypothetical protein